MTELHAAHSSPVIVLGMHRSGTSLLTGSLEAAGICLGDVNHAAPYNRKGNKEHEGLRSLNDRILGRYGSDWRTPPAAQMPLVWTQEEQDEAQRLCAPLSQGPGVWGFKDPRTIWTLEGWLALFPEARMIGVFRHPAEVIKSLMARPGALSLSEEEARSLWILTNQRLLALWSRHRFPMLYFSKRSLNETFFDPLSEFTCRLGLSGDFREFFSDELVNQIAGDEPCVDAGNDLLDALLKCAALSRSGSR